MSVPFSQMQLVGAILTAIDRLGLRTLNCRQFNAVVAAADLIMADLEQPHRKAVPGSGLAAWLCSDETGLSSLHMARVLAPLAGLAGSLRPATPDEEPHHPHDPDDFDRCVKLLEAVPELRPHLPALAEGHGLPWKAKVGAWGELRRCIERNGPPASHRGCSPVCRNFCDRHS